jgi:hypothetical protein
MRRVVFQAVVAGLLAAAAAARAGDPVPPPFDLYETAPIADAELARVSLGGFRVLHQERVDGRTWMLLALPDRAIPADVAGARPRYLGRVRDGERVVLSPPPGPGEPRLRAGRPVTLTPSGAGVAVATESPGRLARRSHGAYRIAERSLPVPRPRTPGPPDAFRAALSRAAGGFGTASADTVRGLVNLVRLDSLANHVRRLSQTASGASDNRWWDPGSPGDASSITAKSDYVRARLEEALGPGSVSQHGFDVVNDDGDTVRVYNVVGSQPSGIPGAGAVLVTAHLDAIGRRSDPVALWAAGYSQGTACDSSALDTDPDCAWDPARDPAPGADDNATGIAAMLEAARLLAAQSFDFDVYYVAFQAEEIGLVGSAAFADSVADASQEIFAVFNMDMLGYNAQTNEVDVVADETSEWIADWLVQSAQLFVPQLPVEKKVEPFGRSDHASFWARGIDAILLNEDIRVLYPSYHSFDDTWESTFPAAGRPNSELQFHLAAQLLVAALGRFALHYDAPDLALPDGELTARPPVGDAFVAGERVRLVASVHNLGSSTLTFADQSTDSLTARVSFYRGAPADGALLAEVTRKAFFPAGGTVAFEWEWDTAGERAGFVEVQARVDGLDPGYVEEEVNDANNLASTTFFLEAPGSESPQVLRHYAFPNPVRGSRDNLRLYYELTREGGVDIDVFDLGGTRVGVFRAGGGFIAEGNRAGANTVDASSFRWESDELESGVYVYAIRVSVGGRSSQTRGKFALVR